MIVIYKPSLDCLSKIIRKNLYLLYMNGEVKQIFSAKPIITSGNAKNINNYLVRAKVYSIERSTGMLPYSQKRCEGCKYFNKTESFTSSVTQNTHKTNHRLNCNGKWLIFLLNVGKMFRAVCCRNTKFFSPKFGATFKIIDQIFKRIFLYSKKPV